MHSFKQAWAEKADCTLPLIAKDKVCDRQNVCCCCCCLQYKQYFVFPGAVFWKGIQISQNKKLIQLSYVAVAFFLT